MDGWVSLEVSPLLANDTVDDQRRAPRSTSRRNRRIFRQDPRHARRRAGHRGGIAAGVPVNVTLLFVAGAVPGGG